MYVHRPRGILRKIRVFPQSILIDDYELTCALAMASSSHKAQSQATSATTNSEHNPAISPP